MDVIHFTNSTSPTKMENGEIVNGLTSKMWVERYREAGEFTFTAPISSNMRTILPIGSLISHMNTTEIMIVENHEINETKDTESEIVISGRSFETFLENRVIQSNQSFPGTSTQIDFFLVQDWSWNQAYSLIVRHILASSLYDVNYALPYVSIMTEWCADLGDTPTAGYRYLKRGPVYPELIKLLEIDNVGIKCVRPGPWSPIESANVVSTSIYSDHISGNIGIVIHKGRNRTGAAGYPQVLFSAESGEIDNADYLFSNKSKKNGALVTGKWLELLINPPETGYNRRVIFVDAHDIDDSFTDIPTGDDYNNVRIWLAQRGYEILASLNDVVLQKVEVSRNLSRPIYRTDYNVGDLVVVSGDYNQTANMRVSEYVEIEDESGAVGYPTLTLD